jgi:hypothetical protein
MPDLPGSRRESSTATPSTQVQQRSSRGVATTVAARTARRTAVTREKYILCSCEGLLEWFAAAECVFPAHHNPLLYVNQETFDRSHDHLRTSGVRLPSGHRSRNDAAMPFHIIGGDERMGTCWYYPRCRLEFKDLNCFGDLSVNHAYCERQMDKKENQSGTWNKRQQAVPSSSRKR